MNEKLIFLIQVYFFISFTCTFILLCLKMTRMKYWKVYERTYIDNLHFIGTVLLLLIGFPIIGIFYILKEL